MRAAHIGQNRRSGVSHTSAMHAACRARATGYQRDQDTCPSTPGRRSPRPTTIPISGSRRSRANARLPGSSSRTRVTLAAFGDASFAADRDTLAAIFDRPDNIPFVTRRGGFLYNFWKDANNPRGLWRRTTLDELSQAEQPAWDVMLDLDALARRGKRGLDLAGAATLPGTHARAMLSLSRGGSDAVVLREFDIDTKAFVERRLHPAGGQGRRRLARPRHAAAVERLRRGHGDHVGLRQDRPAVAARHRRAIRRRCCSRPRPSSMACMRSVDRTGAAPNGLVRRTGSASSITNLWLGDRRPAREDEARPADRRRDGMPSATGSSSSARTPWTVGGKTYAPDTRARHVAAGISGGRSRFHGAVRAGPAARAAGLLLGRRQAGAVDPRRTAARCSRC